MGVLGAKTSFKEFDQGKDRKIILSNEISNANRLRRMRNLEEMGCSLGMEAKTVRNIAAEFVGAYNAYQDKAPFVDCSGRLGEIIWERVWREGGYSFFTAGSISRETVHEFAKCCAELRMSHVTEAYETASSEKISEIKAMIKTYEERLRRDNYRDYPMLLADALAILDEIEKSGNMELIDMLLPWMVHARIGDLETNLWFDMEKDFIRKLVQLAPSASYCVVEYLADDITVGGRVRHSFWKAYGMVNEVKKVVQEIGADDSDQSAVIYSSPVYLNYIKAAFDVAGIPYSIAGNNPAKELMYIRLLIDAIECAANDFLYSDFEKVAGNSLVTFKTVLKAAEKAAGKAATQIGDGEKPEEESAEEIGEAIEEGFEVEPGEEGARGEPGEEGAGGEPGEESAREAAEEFAKESGVQCERVRRPISVYRGSLSRSLKVGWGYDRFLLYGEVLEREIEEASDPIIRLQEKKLYAEFLRDFVRVFLDEENAELGVAAIFANLLAFAKKYTYSRNPELRLIKERIDAELQSIQYMDDAEWSFAEKLDYLKDFLETLTYGEEQKGVLVRQLDAVTVIERTKVFFIGMSAQHFALDTMQSPILSDEEKITYMGLQNGGEYSPVSLGMSCNIKRNRAVRDSLRTMKGGSVSFLYSNYNTVDLLYGGPSVCFMELCGGREINAVDGYDYIKSDVKIESEEVLRRIEIKEDDRTDEGDEVPAAFRISASGLQTFLKCPYKYYYQYWRHFQSPDQMEKSGYDWLPPTYKGNLFHRVTQRYMEVAMPPNAAVSPVMDTSLLDTIYEEEIGKMKLEVPYSTEMLRDYEIQLYRGKIRDFIEREHAEWAKAYENGHEWQILQCELPFDNVIYEVKAGHIKEESPEGDEVTGEETAGAELTGSEPSATEPTAIEEVDDDKVLCRLAFNGAIDRLDAFVGDDGILNLRIADYKTGRKKSISREVEHLTQIQHNIYGFAAADYVRQHLGELCQRFGVDEIKGIKILKVQYVFPYEIAANSVLDVTEIVEGNSINIGKMDLTVMLDKEVSQKVAMVMAPLQESNWAGAQEGLEELFYEVFERSGKMVFDDKSDSNIRSKLCDGNYCNYKSVCRKWVGEV